MTASRRKKQPHALLIPYPLQGHVTPAAHLAFKLAARGFTVTFVNTEAIHHRSSLVADNNNTFPAAAAASGLDIRYELVSDGLPVDFDRSLHHDQFMFALLHVLSAHVEQLLRRLSLRSDPPLTCLVADTFFVWPSTMAKKFNLPYVSFWTEPALVFSLYFHMDLLKKNGHFASPQGNKKDTVTYIPGVPAIEPVDLTSYLQAEDTSTVVHQIIFKAFEEAKAADFVLCNTVEELEPETIAALQGEKPSFYAVGPIFPAVAAPTTSLWEEVNCLRWLDSRPPGSVLYISFGSYAHIGKQELAEIAHGVLLSAPAVGFLWVLRPDVVSVEEPDALPKGFVERSQGRGIVVPWCRQAEVLGHRAVGGFLTHCGWNSILESVWRGLPMLCFPLLTDQFTNRKLVVEDWRIGVDLVVGGSGGGGGRRKEVSREEVAMRINGLMMEGDEVRKNVNGFRKILKNAAGEGGSSEKNFDKFIHDVKDYYTTPSATK